MFTEPLLIITKTWKEPKCSSKGQSIRPYKGMILNRYDDAHNVNELQRHYGEGKRLASKDYILYDSIYMTTGKSKLIGTENRATGSPQVWGEKRV